MNNGVKTYGFGDQLRMSDSSGDDVCSILLQAFPGALGVHKSAVNNDLNGTDYWVEMSSGSHVSVDVKVRERDFGQKDVALEVWSVVENKVEGWTRDPNKRTDYILWYWKDTKRSCLIPFQMLCGAFQDNWREWCDKYKTAKQYTDKGTGYHSKCVFVPVQTVWCAIYRKYVSCPEEFSR